MASTTSITVLSEQLVRLLVPDEAPSSKLRKHLDLFNRTLKHHNYARTNQFEVQERLSGLEEKFHVLNRADLSNALHKSRSELLLHQDRWTPDILDLLLHLSHHPLKYTRLEDLTDRNEKSHVPAALKWSDFDVDTTFDRRDRLWRQPNYGHSSSDDEEGLNSSAATSPSNQRPSDLLRDIHTTPDSILVSLQGSADLSLLKKFDQNLFWNSHEKRNLTEAQLIRDLLFMVQGLPTTIFDTDKARLICKPGFGLEHLSSQSLNTVLIAASKISKAVRSLKSWTNPHQNTPFMQVLEDRLKSVVTNFCAAISNLESRYVLGLQAGGVFSLLKTVEDVQQAARALLTVQSFVRDAKDHDSVGYLDLLLETVCKTEHISASESSSSLIDIFKHASISYVQHLDDWIQEGTLSPSSSHICVQRAPDQNDKARFWTSWYAYSDSESNRPPAFLKPFINSIFTCGKTVAFMRMLGCDPPKPRDHESLASIIDAVTSSSRSTLTPLAPSLSASIDQRISSQLYSATTTIQAMLQNKCNLSSTLIALSTLYLASQPLATDVLDAQIFSKLDRCLPSWNDRFLISSLLSETHSPSTLDPDRVIVHSEPTPPSTLRTSRRSVDILTNIAFDYLLPWPIANILLPETLASYRRVSLLLMQIRRAKYVLDRKAFLRLRVLSSAFSSRSRASRLRKTRNLHTTLSIFTTTLYAHLTSCVISPLTAQLHSSISPHPSSPNSPTSTTIDALIAQHTIYLSTLEHSCLTTKPLKILKDAVLAILHLCVDFGFVVTEIPLNPIDASQHRDKGKRGALPRIREDMRKKDGDGDVDEEGDGDSVLESEKWERKIDMMNAQFKKQTGFLVAGLRGVARSAGTSAGVQRGGGGIFTGQENGTSSSTSGASAMAGAGGTWQVQSQGEMMELLADSLESALSISSPQSRRVR